MEATSDGIDTLNKDVTVTLCGYSETIAGGDFVREDEKFQYKGDSGGITEIKIRDDGRFSVKAKVLDLSSINLDSQVNPVNFSFQIGMLPKYQEAASKMESAGLKTTLFLPHLAKQKEETLGRIRDGQLRTPRLVIWGYNDPTATLNQGQALFDLLAGSEPRSQMHIFNQAGHFTYREHPKKFNDVVRSFIQYC